MSDPDDDSLRHALARHSRDLLRFLTRRVGAHDAPDLAQDAIVRVLSYAERTAVRETGSLLRSTAANLAKDHARRRRTEGEAIVGGLDVDALLVPSLSPEARLDAQEALSRFTAALDALPPRCRQVFVMRRFEDLHQEEIARRLGISRNMVEKHLRTAFRLLRGALK
jgi:RNA polymerase sigma-70 factor (ECF subfamily)